MRENEGCARNRWVFDPIVDGDSPARCAIDVRDQCVASVGAASSVAVTKAVPDGLDVHIVCDNYATHKTDMINNWLARHPRFHVHFTPTGSSWVNQVERFFGLITDKLIRRGVHTSVAALEADIRQWIDTWNENPRPFTWTKTADEILNSLAKYLARISGASH